MFEVGKLCDESLDSLVSELERVSTEDGEGEAARLERVKEWRHFKTSLFTFATITHRY